MKIHFIFVVPLLITEFILVINAMALNAEVWPVVKKDLYKPPLEELAAILQADLKQYFCHVDVKVTDCPDLTQEPFTLANKGLNGHPKLVEVGGPSYLLPLPQKNKLYDLKNIATSTDTNPAFIIGAGAGPYPYKNTNCEGILNINIDGNNSNQQSRIASLNEDGSVVETILPNTETRFALLGNLFISEGKPGKVLKVYVKQRIGNDNFITSIRDIITKHYHGKLIGLGGTFLLKTGKAWQHVMPDFSKEPLHTEDQLNAWLKFYNMSAPLIAVGTLVTQESELDLRLQHFHSFSNHNEGGHYHYDTTPDEVEYIGYFNTGDEIYRIDMPTDTKKIGRD